MISSKTITVYILTLTLFSLLVSARHNRYGRERRALTDTTVPLGTSVINVDVDPTMTANDIETTATEVSASSTGDTALLYQILGLISQTMKAISDFLALTTGSASPNTGDTSSASASATLAAVADSTLPTGTTLGEDLASDAPAVDTANLPSTDTLDSVVGTVTLTNSVVTTISTTVSTEAIQAAISNAISGDSTTVITSTSVVKPFDPSATDITAVYFGSVSNGQGTLEDFAALCRDANIDIINVGFITSFLSYKTISNFGPGCKPQSADGGLTTFENCTELGSALQTCQAMGKKIMISAELIATGNGIIRNIYNDYLFLTEDDAHADANLLWTFFGDGYPQLKVTNVSANATERRIIDPHNVRPFGTFHPDGFDFYIARDAVSNMRLRKRAGSYIAAFLSALSDKMTPETQAQYLAVSLPCTKPALLDLNSVANYLDFLTVRFYNDPACAITGLAFEDFVKSWSDDLQSAVDAVNVNVNVSSAGLPIPSITDTEVLGTVTVPPMNISDVFSATGNLSLAGVPVPTASTSLDDFELPTTDLSIEVPLASGVSSDISVSVSVPDVSMSTAIANLSLSGPDVSVTTPSLSDTDADLEFSASVTPLTVADSGNSVDTDLTTDVSATNVDVPLITDLPTEVDSSIDTSISTSVPDTSVGVDVPLITDLPTEVDASIDTSISTSVPDTSVSVDLPSASLDTSIAEDLPSVSVPDTPTSADLPGITPETSVSAELPSSSLDTDISEDLPGTDVSLSLTETSISVEASLTSLDTEASISITESSVDVAVPTDSIDTDVSVIIPETSVDVSLPTTSIEAEISATSVDTSSLLEITASNDLTTSEVDTGLASSSDAVTVPTDTSSLESSIESEIAEATSALEVTSAIAATSAIEPTSTVSVTSISGVITTQVSATAVLAATSSSLSVSTSLLAGLPGVRRRQLDGASNTPVTTCKLLVGILAPTYPYQENGTPVLGNAGSMPPDQLERQLGLVTTLYGFGGVTIMGDMDDLEPASPQSIGFLEFVKGAIIRGTDIFVCELYKSRVVRLLAKRGTMSTACVGRMNQVGQIAKPNWYHGKAEKKR